MKFASGAANFLGLSNQNLEPETMKETDYQVTDIDFAMKDIGMTKTLFKMSELRKDIQMCNARKEKSKQEKQEKIQLETDQYQAKYDELKKVLLEGN